MIGTTVTNQLDQTLEHSCQKAYPTNRVDSLLRVPAIFEKNANSDIGS